MNGLFFGGMCKYPDLDDSYCKGVVSEARLRLHNVFKAIGVDVRSLLCLLNFEFTFSHLGCFMAQGTFPPNPAGGTRARIGPATWPFK